ncbi:type II toxin-antitoxin system VapC family toxin [Kribbella sp. NPDC051770]|uniref:type II toxin-antitoxin system VapC family toxin n=1 Tax=Kribbella sp. NPDC051770 TaxID=3155413 RepID=UPI00343219C8
MTALPTSGVLDTCTFIDLGVLDPDDLPDYPELTTITLAELYQGVTMAKDPVTMAARAEVLHAGVSEFEPLPFDADAAGRYGSLVALVLDAGRNPRPRRLDLMIAAIASCRGLPLYTRNPDDFKGLGDLLTVHAV